MHLISRQRGLRLGSKLLLRERLADESHLCSRHSPADRGFLAVQVQERQARYQEAQQRHQKLEEEQLDGRQRDSNLALTIARSTESQALAEFAFTLDLFAKLIVDGKIPDERRLGNRIE